MPTPSPSLQRLFADLTAEQAQVANVLATLRDAASGPTTAAKAPRGEVALMNVPSTGSAERDVSTFEPAMAGLQEAAFKKVLVLGTDGALYLRKSLREAGPGEIDLISYERLTAPGNAVDAARSLVRTDGLSPGNVVHEFVRGGSLLR